MAQHGGRTVPLPRTHRPRAPIMSVPAPLTAPLAPLRPAAQHTAAINSLPAAVHHHHHHHGGGAGSGNTATAVSTITGTPSPPVTLTAPRPDAERTTNEYVETPFRGAPVVAPDKPPVLPRLPERPGRLALTNTTSTTTNISGPVSAAGAGDGRGSLLPPSLLLLPSSVTTITKQPVAFVKEHQAVSAAALHLGDCAVSPGSGGGGGIGGIGGTPGSGGIGGTGNIMCPECGRCRCELCQQPRPLPSRWVCDNACLCSADAVIDYMSCLCCVKALYYHCSESDAGATTCADDPCSCGPQRWLARWACLGALAAALPCLLCYWPLRGCQRGVEAAYARHTRAGCRCPRPQPHHQTHHHRHNHPHHHRHGATHTHAATPEKRLLDSSPDY